MESQSLQGAQELLCINTEKVYDWVILQANVSQNVLAAALGTLPIDPCGPTVSNLTTTCYLVDPVTGEELDLNAEIPVDELGEREDRTFVIDGALVTLQRVTFTKPLSVIVEFSGLTGTTPFVEISDPIAIDIPESLYLCAPEGTRIAVRLSDLDCSVNVNCTAGALVSVDIVLGICQSVQSLADVTIELEADFCQPRDVLVEQCPTPAIPPQCPVLFPGNGDNGNGPTGPDPTPATLTRPNSNS
ncbi:hypothetical protein [Sediminibacillus halophilus]|uniref:Uncharacterized protein n=1 Tax=Sediminibacillus halophilus TaxID=482461 RepID=A0A1G9VWK4_9BACI|nr:hypothetical protein [Sediminibacillus halophilus]SDM76326.1 hypothetical protein SAMN05216244_3334 [Sediminibacillus halophilus]